MSCFNHKLHVAVFFCVLMTGTVHRTALYACVIHSEKRVGNVYSKAKSFVDYVRRALQRLDLNEMKLSDSDIQAYHDTHRPRMNEMHAFNMVSALCYWLAIESHIEPSANCEVI